MTLGAGLEEGAGHRLGSPGPTSDRETGTAPQETAEPTTSRAAPAASSAAHSRTTALLVALTVTCLAPEVVSV